MKLTRCLQETTGSTIVASKCILSAHPTIFGRPRPASEAPLATLLISLARPVALSSVILVSVDAKSYAVATNNAAAFESQLAEQNEVLREGEVISLAGAGGSTGRWKVAMAEPVLQGVMQKGYTRFLVLPSAAGLEEAGDGTAGEGHAELEAAAAFSSEEDTGRGAEDSEEEDKDDYEIDEAFLAASVLSPGRHSLPPTPRSPPPSSANGLALTNGHTSFPHGPSSSPTAPSNNSATSIAVLPASLQQPISSPLLIPRPPTDEDDTPRVYLRTSDLGRLGLFSGDWVLVGDDGNEHRRLARAFAGAGLLPDTSAQGYVLHLEGI